MNQYVKEILTKQCAIVDTMFKEIDFEDDLWFFHRQWTKEQESEFIDWLTDYLYTTPKARHEIMNYPVKSKSLCRKAAESFAFNYGWKYIDNK